jgi:selenide,water dikinase
MRAGVRSSLHEANTRAAAGVKDIDGVSSSSKREAQWLLMFDPQTAGGLLAGVPGEVAQECVVALQGRGYSEARVVGYVAELEPGADSFLAVKE